MKKLLLICMVIALIAMFFVGCYSNKTEATSKNIEGEMVTSGKLKEIILAVKDEYGSDYQPSLEYDQQQIKEMFGIDNDNIKEIKAQGPLVSTNIDTFVAVEAVSGKASVIKQNLYDYKEKLLKDQGLSLSDKIKIKQSQIVVYDDYVFYVLLGRLDKNVTDEVELTKLATTENQRAINQIKKILNK